MKYTLPTKYNTGFTVIEMITVIAIFSIMMGVAMANFGLFRSTTDFALSAQEVALVIKEQQQNAMAGKLPNFDPTEKSYPSSRWKPAYGVYFDSNPANNDKMIVFYDNDNVPMYGAPDSAFYEYLFGVNDGSATVPANCVDQATPDYECMKEIQFEKMKINRICRGQYSPPSTCSGGQLGTVSFTFRRPYPDAHIYADYLLAPDFGQIPSPIQEMVEIVFETTDIPGSCNVVTINPIGAVSVHQDKC
jgi:prepilin-type N-terminal cleavage/methylation domain-containing protein